MSSKKKDKQITEGPTEMDAFYADMAPFDFPCVNDSCCARVGNKRDFGIAWKGDDGGYKTFCYSCGQEESFTQESFRDRKKKMDNDKTHSNIKKEKLEAA